MKIYTKTGDKGETGLFGGPRVRKDDPRIESYGDVDELNAVLGLVRSFKPPHEADQELKKIQNDLFDIGAVLATPDRKRLQGKAGSFVGAEDVSFLEKSIDRMEADLPPLQTFVLPGGAGAAAALHLARTVCRRAERRIVSLSAREEVGAEILIYMNRLSDYLFVLARWINQKTGVADTPWEKK